MIIEGKLYKKNFSNFTAYVKDIGGSIDDKQAKILLIKFLKDNIGFTWELMSGVKLLPIQEILLKGVLIKDNSIIVACRGLGKSWLSAVVCCLYPLFNPNCKICLLAQNFRSARRIFETIEKFANSDNGQLLKQCFLRPPQKLPDIISLKLNNGAEVFALPLSSGDGIRGARASAVILDEANFIGATIQRETIQPFISAKQNYEEERDIKEQEDKLIKAGLLKEQDRISFPKNKFIRLSSAGYTFEFFHEEYARYIQIIQEKESTKDNATYFVARISYEALPKESYMDNAAIESAREACGEDSDYFKREYRGLFTDTGSGYFNVKRMHECTVQDTQYPTTQIKGHADSKYILAIDPSYSASKTSDFFGMGVYLLIPEERKMVLVHSYGKAGGDIKDHFYYLTYLLTFFNIVWIGIDASGTEFIDGYNNSTIAAERNLKLDYIKTDLETDEYPKALSMVKNEYNLTNRKIVYPQKFNGESIRRMNEYLQGGISSGKVWFASRISANEGEFEKSRQIQLPYVFKDKNEQNIGIIDFLEQQDDWIKETKSQLALIEVKTTALGTLQYDLPTSIKKSNSENRARKDNYSCMLIGYMASKYYYDMVFEAKAVVREAFVPMAFG